MNTTNNPTEKELTGYPSIDKPWLKYYSEEAINAETPKCSIYENIYQGNCEYLSDIAYIYFGKKITYKELFSEIDKTAKALKSIGIEYGENVAICAPAMPETMYLVLALNKIGANANMLNPTFSEQQLINLINDTEAKLLFVINELYSRVENVIPHTTIKTVISCPATNSLSFFVRFPKKSKKIPNTIQWNDFISKGKSVNYVIPEYKPNHPAVMVYSSGSTGNPKSIQLTNDSINANITQGQYIGFEWKRQDRYFEQVPIFTSTGLCATNLVPLRYGITVIMEPIYDNKVLFSHLVKYRPNFMISTTAFIEYLSKNHTIHPAYSNFKYIVIGGEYITRQTELRFNEWLSKNGCKEKIHKGYGMCECGGTVTATHYKCNDIGSVGIPTPFITVAAFDLETGKELTYGQRGEIRVLTPGHMLGYFKNKEATESYFHTEEQGETWACTGDMGYVMENGCVYVDGRINSSYINTRGETIYLFDIERAILDIEQVIQCRVVVSVINKKKIHIAHVVFSDEFDTQQVLSLIVERCKSKLTPNHFPTLFKLYESALPVAPSIKADIKKMENDTTNLIDVSAMYANQ